MASNGSKDTQALDPCIEEAEYEAEVDRQIALAEAEGGAIPADRVFEDLRVKYGL